MTILRRATENEQSNWLPVPEGLFRWNIGKPVLKLSEQFGTYQVEFPLVLIDTEKRRVEAEWGKPDEGEMQAWRTTYRVGLSLGWFKQGQYQSTKLVDFLCFSMGKDNAKTLRKWFEGGGGPPRPADRDDDQAELEAIGEWLTAFEDLEIYGSIRHEDDKKDPNKKWARFGGPMPVGFLPGQPDSEYQAMCRGKLRLLMMDSGETRESKNPRVEVRYTQQGKEVFTVTPAPAKELEELPF